MKLTQLDYKKNNLPNMKNTIELMNPEKMNSSNLTQECSIIFKKITNDNLFLKEASILIRII